MCFTDSRLVYDLVSHGTGMVVLFFAPATRAALGRSVAVYTRIDSIRCLVSMRQVG